MPGLNLDSDREAMVRLADGIIKMQQHPSDIGVHPVDAPKGRRGKVTRVPVCYACHAPATEKGYDHDWCARCWAQHTTSKAIPAFQTAISPNPPKIAPGETCDTITE